MREELKPCPFCGKKIRHYKNVFACSKCGYELVYTHNKFYTMEFDSSRKSHAAMIDAWNRRETC